MSVKDRIPADIRGWGRRQNWINPIAVRCMKILWLYYYHILHTIKSTACKVPAQFPRMWSDMSPVQIQPFPPRGQPRALVRHWKHHLPDHPVSETKPSL